MEPTTAATVNEEATYERGVERVAAFDVGRRGADWLALCSCGKSACRISTLDLGLWMAAHAREHVL